MEHISQKARKMVMAELQELIQTALQSDNSEAMQRHIMELQTKMQDPLQMEKLITMKQEGILQDIMPQLVPPPNDPMSDPLVQIRMQELALKQQDLVRKTQEDQNDLNLEMAKMQQRAVTDSARIESQEEIAANRNEVNRERIDVQRQARKN
tara:strand:- start:51 stop:506 length:456 start_codon:yes stop_codon:yes gene_type:complete